MQEAERAETDSSKDTQVKIDYMYEVRKNTFSVARNRTCLLRGAAYVEGLQRGMAPTS